MSKMDPSTITLHHCHNGNIVLQFGVTMIHLRPHLFHQFAQMVSKSSKQLQDNQKTLEIEVSYSQPGEA